MAGAPDTVSVGIPAYGFCPHLGLVIDRLLSQTVQPTEIVVVHSGSGDPTAALMAKDPCVRVLHRDRRLFAGAARNIAADHSHGTWQAFIDADVLPVDTWLENLLAAARAHGNGYVVGSVGIARTGGYWGLALWTIEFAGVHPYLPDRATHAIASCTLLVPAAALARVGGFPSHFAGAEDTIFGAKLRAVGFAPWFQANARVDHMNISGFRHFAVHLYGLGRHSALARRAAPIRGRLAIRFWPLALGLFVSKFADTYGRALRWGQGQRWQFVVLAPGVLLGLMIWNAGLIAALRATVPPIDRDQAAEQLTP
ncbi:MAG TPA: glycosyltransferase [Kiloniellales bacterium]|jgi:GT2 family glycosyltransferase